MVLKYFFARLKRNIILTLVGSVTVFLVMVALVVSSAMPKILDSVLINYQRQLCGNADLVLTNSPDTSDRFFGLTRLRDDKVLSDNSEYINGYFKIFTQIQTEDGRKDFCTLFASNYAQLNSYNPITSKGYMPTSMGVNDIIISEEYATDIGLVRGDTVNIIYTNGQTISFNITCIASKQGIFHAGNAVLVSSAALSRITPIIGSDIVTHCFIKAKTPESLAIIEQQLEDDFGRLAFTSAVDDTSLQSAKESVVVPLYCIVAIVIVFCLLSLMLLLRLIFARDRENFALLRNLGLSTNKIITITVLTGVVMCTVAFIMSMFLINAIIGFAASASYLFSGISVGPVSYALGLGGGFVVGVLGSLLNGREKKEKESVELSYAKKAIIHWSLFAISLALGIFAFIFMKQIPLIALVLAVLSMSGVVYLVPRVIAPMFAGLHKGIKNIYSIRLSALSKSPEWQRFVSFITIGVLVVMIMTLVLSNIHSVFKVTYPFDIVVTEIKNSDATLLNKIKAVDGVDDAIACNLQLSAKLYSGDLKISAELIGIEDTRLDFFGLGNFSSMDSAKVNKAFSDAYGLKKGDTVKYFKDRKDEAEMFFTIDEVFDSGNAPFVLIDISKINSVERPYSEIIIKSNNIEDTIRNINNTLDVAVSVIDMQSLVNFVSSMYTDFIWMLDTFTIFVAFLVAITAVLMIVIRRISDLQRQRPLVPLGLSKSSDIKHNIFSLFLALLPVMIVLPILALFVCYATYPIFYLSGQTFVMLFNMTITVITTFIGFGILMVLEITTAAIFSPCNKEKTT